MRAPAVSGRTMAKARRAPRAEERASPPRRPATVLLGEMVGRCGGDRRLCGGGTEDVAGLDDEDESGRDAAVKDVQGEEAAEGVDAPVFRGGDGIGGPGGGTRGGRG